MRTSVTMVAAALLLALTVAGCRPPEKLRELVGKNSAGSVSEESEEAVAKYPPPAVPQQPAGLSYGALVQTNEMSWDVLVPRAVQSGGALVLDTLPQTPANRSGLGRGDVIVGIDETVVTNHDQLVAAFLSNPNPQHTLSVVKASGETVSLPIELIPTPDISVVTYLEQQVAATADPVHRLLLAEFALDQSRAIDLYRGIVAEYPDFAVAKANLAAHIIRRLESVAGQNPALASSADADEARALINSAVGADPGASLYRTRAQIYLALGENSQAESDGLRALDRDPNAAHAYFMLGTSRLKLGDTLAALPALHEAIAQDPFNVIYYVNLALCYRNLGFQQEAQKTIDAGKTLVTDDGIRAQLDGILSGP